MNIAEKARQEPILVHPVDHGMTDGALPGIERITREYIEQTEKHVDAYVMHAGPARDVIPVTKRPVLVHLTGNTGVHGNRKAWVTSVHEAVKYGAEGISVHVNIGSVHEPEQLETLREIKQQNLEYGLPLLGMFYYRTEENGKTVNHTDTDSIKRAVRAGYEAGCDIIKTSYTPEFQEVVGVAPCTPVIIAGGSKTDTPTLVETTRRAIQQGARGVAVGRNIFQAQDPVETLNELWNAVKNTRSMVPCITSVYG